LGETARLQPGVQLGIAGKVQPRREQVLARIADLVLDLTLLPARRRRARGRFDQVMRAHRQKAPVEAPLLADEHRIDRRGHVVVDAAPAHPAKQAEGVVVRVEHHLLALARIGPHQEHPAVAEPDVRHLDRGGHPAEHHNLMRPVELIGLARREPQRDKHRAVLRLSAPPLADMALHAVVGTGVTFGTQQLEQPPCGQVLARRTLAVRLQHRVEPRDKRPKPRLRLNLALVAKLGRRSADRLAHRLPRDPQLAHNLADRLLINPKRPPDPANRFHRHHPRPRSPKHNQGEHSMIRGWVAIRR
jgi:hypothetical protein